MKLWTRTLGLLLLLTTLGIAEMASAKTVARDFGLTPTNTACDVTKATYKYVATWKAPAEAKKFQINTGNVCRFGQAVCPGGNTAGCAAETSVICNTTGHCSVPLHTCGSGVSRVQVIAFFAAPKYYLSI